MSETEVSKSEYQEILDELKNKLNAHAKDYVPRLANALKDEDKNRTSSDIVDIIKASCGYWQKETIREFIPEELKDKVKQKAGKKGAATTNIKKAQEMLVDGSIAGVPDSNTAENTSDDEIKPSLGPSVPPTGEYERQARKLLQDALDKRDKEIDDLKAQVAQKTIQVVKPDEEPDDYVKNLEIEVTELRKQVKHDFVVGSWCPPNSNVYGHPNNHWKELLAAIRHVGYDIVPYYKEGLPVPPQSRGFNMGVTNGEFDGFFGIK